MQGITRRTLLTGLGVVAFGGSSTGAYAFAIEPRFRLSVARYDLALPAWPADRPPLKVAALSDIHVCKPWMSAGRVRAIARAARALEPDLVVLLGDIPAGVRPRWRTGTVPMPQWSMALSSLAAPLGVYSVLGNHDWWHDAEEVRTGLRRAGIQVLENDAVRIARGGHRFWLAGLGDQLAIHVRGARYRGLDDLPGTLKQVEDDDPVILLAHEPDIFVKVPDRVALTLAGHTHGGQVFIPFLGRPVVPSRYGQRFAYGHVVEQGRHLVVSGGLGCSIMPVRFLVPPEITFLTIRGSGAAA